ncbi:mycothione reductase [Mycobacterium parmense]|uniref:Mycothione reductase n=1 Tax=Mycobacterium parmense TaxID=185642 RepID=A0A7I7YQ41_9MYCO|nr:mycothione reductase [Mycobacterium parmense]MCV7349587.1 mycothione reductase [Mycobacterium parmense]ORW58877.1 mycothione reductase [Mycobacterium parmense]BBZ43779.1 mycothione reductase [Mycobacterium parmense]
MRHHNLVVIGTGSGNMVVDDSFAGSDVALIEERKVGGTCVNFGCIPSKMLAYTAEVADIVAGAEAFGVGADLGGMRWRAVRDRVFGRTDHVSAAGRRGREETDWITVYSGRAEFTGRRRLVVDDGAGHRTELSADQVVVATGGRPVIPPPVQESGLPYETSDTLMRIDAPPRRLAVLGGGYIAAELAHVLSAAGSELTIIEKADHLLGASQDHDVRAAFTELMAKRHDVRLGAELLELSGEPGALVLTLDDGGTVEADMLLVATGRRSNADRMNPAAAGIDTHDDGRIKVDRFCRTSAEGVFALGDVSTPVPLKHVANREAGIVAHNLRHPARLRAIDHDLVPSAVFTDPQIASVGLTEEHCRESHPDYLVGVADYGDVAYGWAMQNDSGFCKVLVDAASDRILGAHIMGPQAASLIQTFVVAIEFGIGASDLAHRPYWIHPALTEVMDNALRATRARGAP